MFFCTSQSAANLWRKYAIIFLSFFWSFGFFFGLFYAFHTFESYRSLFLAIASDRHAVVILLILQAAPLLISAFAARFAIPALMLPVAFVKAFCFSFCSFGFIWAFGSAGWLIRCLYLFTDTFVILFLLWFWARHINGSRKQLCADVYLCISAIIFIGTIDCLIITPILHSTVHF